MCRFIAYRGRPVLLDDVLHKPKNSLIRQSATAREAEEPLNGDGFGLGWYVPEIEKNPGLFVSVRPAWNDRNLRYLCSKISTPCFLAHVRAASEGEVSEANCHPFHYKQYLFMHNGGLGGFQKMKRQIRRKLSDEIYDWVRGQTDSEHFFALFLENLSRREGQHDSAALCEVLEATIRETEEMKKAVGETEASYINCVVTNGDVMVGVRYVSDLGEPASTLYFSEGHHYECIDGDAHMVPGKGREHSVLIVSEKLTSNKADWKEIPTNHFCVVDEKMEVKIRPVAEDLALKPIKKVAGEGGGFKPKVVK